MSKNKYNSDNPCTNELQWSIFDSSNQKLTSDIFDIDGREIELGDTVRLTFNSDSVHRKHRSIYDVIWKDAAYKIKSEYGKESFLGAIANNVKIEVLDD
jgi:hypothetical protein